jgi:hypothetical protein
MDFIISLLIFCLLILFVFNLISWFYREIPVDCELKQESSLEIFRKECNDIFVKFSEQINKLN